jgi:tetratricopeptide (TPR) repeat protein
VKRLAVILLALSGCSSEPRPSQADRLNAAGADALAAGRPRTAVARFSAAAESSGARDDHDSLARDLHNRGLSLIAAGELAEGCDDLSESLRLADDAPVDDRLSTRLALAAALAALGRTAEATECIDLALAERDGAAPLRARALSSRAALALRRGDVAAAQGDLAAAERLCGGDVGAQGAVAVNRGHAALRSGDLSAAGAAYAAATVAFRTAGDHAGLAAALEGSARTAEAQGERAAAAQAWRRAAAVPHGGPAARERRLAEAARLSR